MFRSLLLFIMMVSLFPAVASADEEDRGVLGNSCAPYGIFIKKKRVQESVKFSNLSKSFLNNKKVSFSWRTTWEGKMNCRFGSASDTLFFFSPFGDNPVYAHFINPHNNNEQAYWIKFTSKITGVKKMNVYGPLPGVRRLARYQTDYTLTAELLDNPPGPEAAGVTKVISDGIVSLVPAVLSGHGGADNSFGNGGNKSTYGQEAWDAMMNNYPSSSWNTDHFLAFERVSFQFAPNQTTCELAHDVMVNLRPVSMDELLKGGMSGERRFTLPIACDTPSGIDSATRNIRVWIASNDVLGTGSTGDVMVNDDSDAEGVGIALRKITGEPVMIANGLGPAAGATELLSITQGSPLQSRNNLQMVAGYRLYDKSALKPGRVVATAQVMFAYD